MKYFDRDFYHGGSYDLRPSHFVTDRAPTISSLARLRLRPSNDCGQLPRHGSADEDDLPQTAEDTCTALGDHTLCDQVKVAQRMKRRSRTRHVRLSAVSHMATMAWCAALPPHGPRLPGRAFLA